MQTFNNYEPFTSNDADDFIMALMARLHTFHKSAIVYYVWCILTGIVIREPFGHYGASDCSEFYCSVVIYNQFDRINFDSARATAAGRDLMTERR